MRRILTEIKLEKVAAVSSPAQEGALALIMKSAPKQQQDDEQIEDDWSKTGSRRKKQKQPRGWSRDDIDTVNKKKPVKHPFEHLVDNLARGHGVPKYVAQSLARRQSPQSYRHFQQQGIEASQPKVKKAAPDDAVIAWDQAVHTWQETHGADRCTSMSEIRKRAPALWQRFRGSK